jgi:mono/diheme cytochrome c family protein
MEAIYKFLEGMGIYHPLHPPFTHIPVGLVIGALIFILASVILRRPDMKKTAWHCFVLALIFAVPTTFLGVTDWQHFYASTWSNPIQIKVALTVVLFVLLLAGAILAPSKKTSYPLIILIYLLSSMTVAALGFYGAQLVYAAKGPAGADFQQGEKLYAANCGACHPNGGNAISPDLPVLNSPQMKDPNTFIKFNRSPVKADGSRGIMPAFTKDKLSDDDLRQIYQYVKGVLAKKPGE